MAKTTFVIPDSVRPVLDTASDTETIERPPAERTHFRALLAGNPNYFGTLGASPLAAEVPIQCDKRFEEIGCVGFHPQVRRLDAVIYVKQPFGYGGDICTRGTQECVRFYLSYDNGTSWDDLGTASVTVYDVPTSVTNGRRLEYAVHVPCAPRARLCLIKNVVLVRAILSWDYCPPANQPNWKPVWGEVHNTNILVEPRRRLPWFELFNEISAKLPTSIAPLLNLDQEAEIKVPAALSLAQLHALYRDKGVEPHRYALPAVQKLLAQSSFGGPFAELPANGLFGDIGLKPAEVLGPILNPKDGNTFYEELDCVGYDPVTSELSAVFRVKRPFGYGGNPCTAGSREFVTFWADLNNNGTFETCLGNAEVRVYDIEQDIPGKGLEYSVFLPVNFGQFRQDCREGPRVIPIRAILSWNAPAECPFPNRPPVWGNHEDTLILLAPGRPVVAGNFSPVLFNISTIAVCDIDQANGLTSVGDRPFGGALYIVGDIPAANGLAAPDRVKYRLFVRQRPPSPALPGSWQPIANDFNVTINQQSGILTQFPFVQQVDPIGPYAGYYTYRDYGIGTGTWRKITAPYVGLLGVWNTALPLDGLWEIRVEAVDTVTGITYVADVTHCPDGTTRQNVVVHLDEVPPVPSITITDYSTDNGATWIPAIACGDFNAGVLIRGTYSVTDDHFGTLSLSVLPSVPANGASPTPSARSYPVVPTTGETGTWTLNTAGMEPCGYVVFLDTHDRTIVSASGGWQAHDSVGFCLRAG